MESNEIKKVITIDGTGAVSSLNNIKSATDESVSSFETLSDAKEYIDSLKESLNGLDESSEEYKSTCKEIESVQTKLKDSIKAASDDAIKLSKSYDQLEAQMADLKRQWKTTTDEAKRAKLGEQIKGINDQLKGMDASIGNFERNVGNYEGAFTDAFSKMSDSMDLMIPGTKGVSDGVMKIVGSVKALKVAFASNPWGAALTVALGLVTAIAAKIRDAKKDAEDTAGIEASTDVSSLKKFNPNQTQRIPGYGETWMDVYAKNAKEFIPEVNEFLAVARRADYEIKKFDEDTARMMEAQGASQTEILIARKKLLSDITEEYTYALDKLQGDITKNERLLEEQEAADRASSARRDFRDRPRIAIYTREQLKIAVDIFNKGRQAVAEQNQYINNLGAEIGIQTRVTKELDKQVELAKSKEEIESRAARARAEIDAGQAEFISKKESEAAEIAQINEELYLGTLSDEEKETYALEREFERRVELYKRNGEDITAVVEWYMRREGEIYEKYHPEPLPEAQTLDTSKLSQIDEEFALQSYIADKTIQIEYEKNQKLLELDKARLLQKKTALQEILSADNLSAEERKKYAEELAKVDADIIANSEQSKNAELLHAKEIVNIYSDMTSSLGDLMSTIAGIWEDNINARYEAGEITEKQAREEFENNKKMQISSAILTGLAGIASAVASPVAAAMGPPGWIAAGVQAAVIAANTAAQIVKIKQTQFGGGSVSSSSVSTTPSSSVTGYIPNYFTNVTGKSETEDLKNAVKDQKIEARVYVLESDIRDAGSRVEVRDSESTF